MKKSLGYIYRNPGRKVWMMKYYKDGAPIRESCHTEDETEAEAALAAATTDTARGQPTAAAVGKLTVEQAGNLVLTDYENNDHDSYDDAEGRLRNHIYPFFGKTRKLVTVDTTLIGEYISHRRKQKPRGKDTCTKPATINRETALISRMFTLALRAKLLAFKPHITDLKEHNVRKGFFEDHAFEAVCRLLKPEIADVAILAYVTGWRVRSEILVLEWRQIDLQARTITLDPGQAKNDEGRTFPITGDLYTMLTRRDTLRKANDAAGHVCPSVFFRVDATGRPTRVKSFRKQWATATTDAGCPGKLVHDFRRTAIRNMSRRDVGDLIAMKLTGHKTRAVFDRYNIVDERDLRQAGAKLEDQVSKGTGTRTGTRRRFGQPAKMKSAK